MSIFDKYDLDRHDLTIQKTIKMEEGVFLKVKNEDY
jgi:hypothetical protein